MTMIRRSHEGSEKMNLSEVLGLMVKLINSFHGSFFNERDEFIADKKSNQYFNFGNCESELDVKCKVLEWLSRSACKGQPYSQEWRNKKYNEKMRNGINLFLNTNFTESEMMEIYTYLGNAINHAKTIRFIENGYDFNVLKDKA